MNMKLSKLNQNARKTDNYQIILHQNDVSMRQECDNEEKNKLHYFNTVYVSQVLNRKKIHAVLY